ncbi:MAG: YicC family protein [Clostridiales Family XIII bacterium]|nr:YicC family protein [Clostridiales Family XIII bacterium]
MPKSMTGYGRGEFADGRRAVAVEMKSVNHRYCEISVRLPRKYGFAEELLKSVAKEAVSRGKVEISASVDSMAEEDFRLSPDLAAAGQYVACLQELRGHFGLEGGVTLELLAGMPDVIRPLPEAGDEEGLLAALEAAMRGALAQFDAMREAEGEKLAEDMRGRARAVAGLADEIDRLAPEAARAWAGRLRERMAEFLGQQAAISEDRIALEAAIFADKANVTEEIVRLKSHVSQLEAMLSESGANGKKMDFLIQEMNREANTIGSKANDIGISSLMLEIKSEVEKIREQAQNIE